jgi:LPXTG-motif cell wall-anchored protein
MAGAPSAMAEDVDIVIVGSRDGGTLAGFLPPGSVETGITVPASTPYPTADPDGYDPYEGNTSLFRGQVVGTDDEILLYCAEILIQRTDNYSGVSREESGIPNAGLVAQLLRNTYPFNELPAGVPLTARSVIVQSALWYFTDGFVVGIDSPYRDVVAALVNQTIEQGPYDETTLDLSFALNGPSGEYDVNTVIGPFTTVTADDTPATFTVSAGTAQVYLDAAGTSLVAPGTELASGTPFWVKATASGPVTVTANGTITGSTGVYFRDFDADVPSQTLVSATAVRYAVSGSAEIDFTGVLTPELAKTGSEGSSPLLAGAMLLILAGGAFVIVRRSRAAARG